jgi:aerobic-type carbon monoxide dehydrogenase small subunit (CoxS/CutS family)
MSESVSVRVNGNLVAVRAGSTVAVAVLASGATCRASVTGQPRSPLCGMGTCFECRVAINGEPRRRSCQVLCEANMEIETDG